MRQCESTTAVALGAAIRRLRSEHGVTTTQVADAMRAQGMRWTAGRVSKLENGTVTLTPEVLYVVAGVLSALLRRDVTVADLVPEDRAVRLTPDLVVSGAQLSEAFRGGPVRLPSRGPDLDDLIWAAAERERQKSVPDKGWSDQDEAGAWRANEILTEHLDSLSRADHVVLNAVTPDDHLAGLIAALKLWKATPLVERDRRAPDGANAQKLGRITRDLIAELSAAVQGAGDE